MSEAAGDPPVEYEPRLIEHAVLLAVSGRDEELEFRARRDRVYEIADPEERERVFRAFHAAWFERLGLDHPVRRALLEEPRIVAETRACVVALAFSKQAEGADLFVAPSDAGGRTVGIRLRPERFTDEDGLLRFLRHELLHIADMLDPGFRYTRDLRGLESDAAYARLIKDRYRVLWGVSVDGRLVRRGVAPVVVRTARLAEFARAFAMLGDQTEEIFKHFFEATSPTHPELAAFALNPSRFVGGDRQGPSPGERCPLCRLPTHAFEPDPDRLPPELLGRVRDGFPEWEPRDGLCRQCADLYRSRLAEVVR